MPHGMKTWHATWYENLACHMVWKQGRFREHNWVGPLIVLLEATAVPSRQKKHCYGDEDTYF